MADVNFKTELGYTPLTMSLIGEGHEEVVKLLLDHEANKKELRLKKKDDAGSTPLHLAAARRGHGDVVQLLIEKGADVHAEDSSKSTALHFAASMSHKDIVKLLLLKGADILKADQFDITPICIIISNGLGDILINEKVNINFTDANGFTALHVGASFGNLSFVEYCAQTNVRDINVKNNEGETPLHLASRCNFQHIVSFLIDKEADVFTKENNKKSTTGRRLVNHRLDIVKILIQEKECGASFKINGNTLLHLLAAVGSLEMTKYFVDNGADVHAKDSTGYKPVHVAAVSGFKEIVEFYLDGGIHVSDLGCDHLTLLHLAAQAGKSNVCELLIERSADVSAVSIYGSTPFTFGCWKWL
ncbi:hypothetical protein CEXT_499351 [Caerostris extrusa]|uniref:Alpha-latrotoxin n=1 Tax=Caerostris extrusa TaxID=172846 RepID=A0AAV4SE53_CAEEX|nr:hypothetical protein CEXT_499351 [Caerostris extrusa]